jgi:hypothetical protein
VQLTFSCGATLRIETDVLDMNDGIRAGGTGAAMVFALVAQVQR